MVTARPRPSHAQCPVPSVGRIRILWAAAARRDATHALRRSRGGRAHCTTPSAPPRGGGGPWQERRCPRPVRAGSASVSSNSIVWPASGPRPLSFPPAPRNLALMGVGGLWRELCRSSAFVWAELAPMVGQLPSIVHRALSECCARPVHQTHRRAILNWTERATWLQPRGPECVDVGPAFHMYTSGVLASKLYGQLPVKVTPFTGNLRAIYGNYGQSTGNDSLRSDDSLRSELVKKLHCQGFVHFTAVWRPVNLPGSAEGLRRSPAARDHNLRLLHVLAALRCLLAGWLAGWLAGRMLLCVLCC
eukprot:gene24473-biopygen1374